jgi:type I restriction enzyme S subunit
MYNIWTECPTASITELLSFVVDNRGKTVPTADSGWKLIATNCVTNSTLFPTYEKIRYLSEETYQTWFRAHPKSGDILFVNKGTPGRVCMVPDQIDFCIAQDMIALRADDKKIYNKYLFAVLRSSRIQTQIYNTSVGDVIPHFKKQYMDQLLIPIPNRTVQEAIGDFYYALSYKTELNKQINKRLEKLAQAIFKSWFVDFEPWGGVMPEDWETTYLSALCSLISRGITPKYVDQGEQIVINQKCIRDHQVVLSPSRFHEPKTPNDKWLQYGDVLVNSTGQGTLGRAAQWLESLTNVTVDSHVSIVRPSTPQYIYYLGLFVTGKEKEIEAMAVGSTGQTELSRERLGSLLLLQPKSEQLEEFNKLVEPLMTQIVTNNHESESLTSLRDVLLPKLMSGELSVPID